MPGDANSQDFGLHNNHILNDVIRMKDFLESFHTWPEAGGYFDQDADLMDDVLIIKWREDLLERKINTRYSAIRDIMRQRSGK